MADLSHDVRTLGSRYSIVIHHHADTCAAYMTARGRKQIWTGYGATPEAAKADVLRYLDSRLHPFVAVKSPAPSVTAGAPS